jgi:hypothetical protein
LLNLPKASSPDPRIEASDYDFRNVGFLGNLTNTTPLLLFSSVNNARLDHCLFASAGALTNMDGQGAGIQMADDYNPAPGGLIGVVITNNGDNCVEFESCFFLGLAWGLDIYSDHNRVRDCNFGSCGSWAKTNFGTLYATNSIRCFGGAILDQSGGDIIIEGNHFFHCPCGVLANSAGGYGIPIYQNNLIEDCNYGFIGGQQATLVNNQYHVVHKQTLGFVYPGSPQLGVSAASDGQNILTYSLLLDVDSGNFVSIRWNEYSFLTLDPQDNLVLPLGTFTGDGSGLTNLSAGALATNSPFNGAGLVAGGPNAAKWTRDGGSWTNLAATNIVGSRFVPTLSGSATNLAARSLTNSLAALAVTAPGSAEDFAKPGIVSVNGTGNTNLLQIAEFIDGSHQFPELNFKGNVNNLGTWNFIDFVSGQRCGYVQFYNDGAIGSSDFGMAFNADSSQNLVVTCNGDLNVSGSKNFLIPHPLGGAKTEVRGASLRHATVEAPRGELVYRGSVTLTNGSAVDSIDRASGMTVGTFAALTRAAQALRPQNETGWDEVRARVVGGDVVIECCNTNSTDRVSWAVIAERADPAYLSSASVRSGKFQVEPTAAKAMEGRPTGD